MSKSDPNRIIRLIPLISGGLGGILLVINRFSTELLNPSQARSDVLGVILSSVLILVGLLWQQVQPRSPEVVDLIGTEGFELAPDLPELVRTELAWASHLLLNNTATKTLLVYYQGRVLLRRGILKVSAEFKLGEIVERVMATQKPVYLVALKLYPGSIQFDYLPENTQGLICYPLNSQGVLILGANAPRSYTQKDESWIAGIADKLGNTIEKYFDE